MIEECGETWRFRVWPCHGALSPTNAGPAFELVSEDTGVVVCLRERRVSILEWSRLKVSHGLQHVYYDDPGCTS